MKRKIAALFLILAMTIAYVPTFAFASVNEDGIEEPGSSEELIEQPIDNEEGDEEANLDEAEKSDTEEPEIVVEEEQAEMTIQAVSNPVKYYQANTITKDHKYIIVNSKSKTGSALAIKKYGSDAVAAEVAMGSEDINNKTVITASISGSEVDSTELTANETTGTGSYKYFTNSSVKLGSSNGKLKFDNNAKVKAAIENETGKVKINSSFVKRDTDKWTIDSDGACYLYEKHYTINENTEDAEKITLNKTHEAFGQTVTFSTDGTTPIVKKTDQTPVEVNKGYKNSYSFIMPQDDVTISLDKPVTYYQTDKIQENHKYIIVNSKVDNGTAVAIKNNSGNAETTNVTMGFVGTGEDKVVTASIYASAQAATELTAYKTSGQSSYMYFKNSNVKLRYTTHDSGRLQFADDDKEQATVSDGKVKINSSFVKRDTDKWTIDSYARNGNCYLYDSVPPAKTLTEEMVSLDKDSFEYNGKAQQPTVTVKDGDTPLEEGTDYELTVEPQTNVGNDYEVSVKGKGKYNGTVTKTWKITPKSVTLTWNYTEPFTYDGKSKTVSAEISEGIIETDKEKVELEVSDNMKTDAGEYEATAQLKDKETILEMIAEIFSSEKESVAANYVISNSEQKWEIKKATNNTITKPEIKGWTYGGYDKDVNAPKATATFGNPTFTYYNSGRQEVEGVPTQAGDYTVVASVAETDNYNGARSEETKFTIAKATATVTANDASKVYGAEEPTLTATVTGLENGDDENVITYTLSRDEGEDVGTYDITPTGDADQGNYDVSYEKAENGFEITKATATVTANDANKAYGTEDPQLTATVTGLKNNDPASVITYTLSRDEGGFVGTYVITATGATEQNNYNVEYVDGTFTITEAAATVTANNKTKKCKAEDPGLTATVTGLVGDDEIEYTLSRENGESVGTYKITATGDAVQGNYSVTYVPGTFTIEHDFVIVQGVEPKVGKAGYKAAYECTGCGEFFSDIEGKDLIGDRAAYEKWIAEGGAGYLAAIPEEDKDKDKDGTDTGDNANLMLFLLLGLATAGVGGYVYRRREN